MQIQKIDSNQNFNGKIYTCGLNEYQMRAVQKVSPGLIKIMRWRFYDLNIINNEHFINSVNKNNQVIKALYSTKIQLKNKIFPNIIKEKDIDLSPIKPNDIVTTVKELFKKRK